MMRKQRNKQNGTGKLLMLAGTLILLALILPGRFWWFALGLALISLGIWYNNCR